jgi:hypothetical protein
MNPCRFAGDCQQEGRVLVRIPGVGDRRVCLEHLSWMVAVGMDHRRLDTDDFVPQWRQRGAFAKDLTGRLA